MKRIIFLFVFIFAFSAVSVSAESVTDKKLKYEQAKFLYATANACLAAYDNKVGNIFYTFMQYDGWEAERLEKQGDLADVNIFLARMFDEERGKTVYIMSFRGTASKKDVRLDKRTGRVLFDGASIDELTQNAEKKDVEETLPKVHKGFMQYALAAFSVDLAEKNSIVDSTHFYEVLKGDPNSEVILTGHSLGGAGAVLYAATLINMGVPKEQIKVVTFGAPAVGNKAFAEAYQDKIDMIRIYSSFDPVPGGLQSFHRYIQFGTPFVLTSDPRRREMQHSMENYADLVGKYYYDCKQEAIDAGIIDKEPQSYDEGEGKVVAIAILPSDNAYNLSDFKYAKENLLDIYRLSFFRYRILDTDKEDLLMLDLEDKARKAGADYLLVARIGIDRVRTSNHWVVSLDQGVFNLADGSLVKGMSKSVRQNYSASFLQASSYNGFRAVESLYGIGAGWVRPLEYSVAE